MLQLCRYFDPAAGPRLGAVLHDQVVDLSASGEAGFASLQAWLDLATREGVAAAAEQLRKLVDALPAACTWEALQRAPDRLAAHVLPPVDQQEVWAAGVTYLRSREAREEESAGSGIYDRVYDAPRPEIFFKATPQRVVGSHDFIAVRSDAHWTVPEPELTILLTPNLQVAGYTIGNDVSSRDIEAENPLYLPQAKIYARSCSMGPAVTLAADFENHSPAAIELIIRRERAIHFQGKTTTGQMKRSVAELVHFLGRDNSFPQGVCLMTGTGIVPPDEFSLLPGDEVEIRIDRIGRLINRVAGGQEHSK